MRVSGYELYEFLVADTGGGDVENAKFKMKNVKLQIKMQNLNVGTVGAPLVGALNPHPGTGGDKPPPLPHGNECESGNRNESVFGCRS